MQVPLGGGERNPLDTLGLGRRLEYHAGRSAQAGETGVELRGPVRRKMLMLSHQDIGLDIKTVGRERLLAGDGNEVLLPYFGQCR